MLAPMLILFSAILQFPVPTSNAPVTRTDEFKKSAKVGFKLTLSFTSASLVSL